jgi:hypothetical protein
MTEESKKKYAPRKPFPSHTLQEALVVAEAIQNKNAGKPWKPIFVGEAINKSPTSNAFRDVTSSSYKYGLTQGTWNAQYISLTALGSSITKPLDATKRVADLQRAVQEVELFKSIYEHYRDSKFPSVDDKYFKNMLEVEFHVPRELVDECARMLIENGKFTGIIREVKGMPFVVFAETPVEMPVEAPAEAIGETRMPLPEEEKTPSTSISHVFISHSKNATILDQIKTILEFGQFRFVVAEEVETTSIPIPDKIFGLMRECDCAIMSVTADEKERNSDGSYRVNPNVLIEIGAAFLAYNKKVILLADKRVVLPSNLQGLYRCEYEGDELSFSAALKLQKALAQFREIS